jgi:hypothetical protein
VTSTRTARPSRIALGINMLGDLVHLLHALRRQRDLPIRLCASPGWYELDEAINNWYGYILFIHGLLY